MMLNAVEFWKKIDEYDIPRTMKENPIQHGIASTAIGIEYDQIIHPWQFGHMEQKQTCLWLKGLPLLTPTDIVPEGEKKKFESGKRMSKWMADTFNLPPSERARARSKTFPGIAKAMAEQWAGESS